MKKYRACTIKLIDPKQLEITQARSFDGKTAAFSHRVTKWDSQSRHEPLNKSKLGSGTFKTVYAIDGKPPEYLSSLDVDYVLAKLRKKEGRSRTHFVWSTLQDVLAQMLVHGQKETTIYFSNLDRSGQPNPEAYRYCLYMPRLRGGAWKLATFPIAENIGLLDQVFTQLKSLHVRGFYHSDVKPDNVMVKEENYEMIATLIDFGGLNRIWQSRTVSSPAYDPFHPRRAYWSRLRNNLQELMPPKENQWLGWLSQVEKLFQAIENKVSKNSSMGRSRILKPITQKPPHQDYLTSMYGIYLDMGSVVQMLGDILTGSVDSKANEGNKLKRFSHEERLLWEDCLQCCFTPNSVYQLVEFYRKLCGLEERVENPFSNTIHGASDLSVEWASIYGIDLDELSEGVAKQEISVLQQKQEQIDGSYFELMKQNIELLSKTHDPRPSEKLRCYRESLQHVFEEYGQQAPEQIRDIKDVKKGTLALIHSRFVECDNFPDLKQLLEKFFYVALINRNTNFLWRARKFTTTFETLCQCIENADKTTVRDQNGKPLIGTGKFSTVIADILGYPDLHRVISKDNLYTSLKKNQKGFDWVFDYNKQGNADLFLECINNTFEVKSKEGKGTGLEPVHLALGQSGQVKRIADSSQVDREPLKLPNIEGGMTYETLTKEAMILLVENYALTMDHTAFLISTSYT